MRVRASGGCRKSDDDLGIHVAEVGSVGLAVHPKANLEWPRAVCAPPLDDHRGAGSVPVGPQVKGPDALVELSEAGRISAFPPKSEGEGTVLDNSCLMFLSNMWSGNKHDSTRLPILTVGGLGGTLSPRPAPYSLGWN